MASTRFVLVITFWSYRCLPDFLMIQEQIGKEELLPWITFFNFDRASAKKNFISRVSTTHAIVTHAQTSADSNPEQTTSTYYTTVSWWTRYLLDSLSTPWHPLSLRRVKIDMQRSLAREIKSRCIECTSRPHRTTLTILLEENLDRFRRSNLLDIVWTVRE